jgi:hypothetical protein
MGSRAPRRLMEPPECPLVGQPGHGVDCLVRLHWTQTQEQRRRVEALGDERARLRREPGSTTHNERGSNSMASHNEEPDE